MWVVLIIDFFFQITTTIYKSGSIFLATKQPFWCYIEKKNEKGEEVIETNLDGKFA